MKRLATISTLFLTILCIAPCKLPAQSECSILHFNTANGLSQNTITGLAFDKSGYLWIGTQNGLIRYDGVKFKTYLFDTKNNGSNSSATVVNISAIPPDNKLLIKMRDGLVYTIENGRPLLYSTAVKNASLYYAIEGYFPSLALFDQFNLPDSTLHDVLKWSSRTRAILPVNKTDFIVLGKNDKELLFYKNGRKEKAIQLNCYFSRFLKSGKLNLMVDDKSRLYLFDPVTIHFKEIVSDWSGFGKESNRSVAPVFLWDKQDEQSYCFYNSVFYFLRFDIADHAMKFIPLFSTKNERHFWSDIVYDSINSTYFLSTYNEGLYQFQLKQIQTISFKDRLVNDTTKIDANNYALLKTSDTTVLTANGFEIASNSTYEIAIRKKGNISGNAETIARLGDTAILCVQYNQLFYYLQFDKFQHRRVFSESFNKDYSSFVTLLQPEGDSVWVCSDLGIFSVRKNNVRVLFYRKRDGQSLYFGPHLFYRLSGQEVLFSNDLGLFKLKTSSPYTIDTFPEMKNKQVTGIAKYKDVFLLSAYKYGLFVFKDNAFYKVPISADQHELDFCHSIYIDTMENVWLTTDKGLFRSSVTSIVESVSKPGIQPFFFSYGKKNGLINTEFNRGGTPAYAVLASGQLFYPAAGGLITFNPITLNSDFVKGPILFDKIQVDDTITDASFTDTIYLKPDFKLLGINLSIAHFGEPDNLLLEYKLDNESWKIVELSASQRITLYDIAAGYHQLVIRRRTGFGSNDYVFQTLFIYRRKHLYQQLWFYPALTVAFIFLILLIIKLRSRNIDNQRTELQTLVNEQTSELSKAIEAKELLIDIISGGMITPLRHVSLIAGLLRKDIGQNPGKVREVLSDIKATSGKILADSLGIINYMKYNSSRVVVHKRKVNLYDAVNEVCDSFLAVTQAKNIRLVNQVNKFLSVEIDDTIFEIILNNVISNSITFSGGNIVQIYLEQGSETKTEIVLIVKDNGNGTNSDLLRKIKELLKENLEVIKTIESPSVGLSYVLISELTRIHGLSISVESELNMGTVVSIVIPNNLSVPESITF